MAFGQMLHLKGLQQTAPKPSRSQYQSTVGHGNHRRQSQATEWESEKTPCCAALGIQYRQGGATEVPRNQKSSLD